MWQKNRKIALFAFMNRTLNLSADTSPAVAFQQWTNSHSTVRGPPILKRNFKLSNLLSAVRDAPQTLKDLPLETFPDFGDMNIGRFLLQEYKEAYSKERQIEQAWKKSLVRRRLCAVKTFIQRHFMLPDAEPHEFSDWCIEG